MRCTQYIGLTSKAQDWLKERKARELCKYVGDTGMFDEPLNYRIFEVQDKLLSPYSDYVATEEEKYLPWVRTIMEYTQAKPWSSGPMYFVALKDISSGETIPDSLWDEAEFSKY